MELNEITYQIRGAAFDVYNKLGPGLLESVYSEALALELNKRFLEFKKEEAIPVNYDDLKFEIGFRADFIVEDKVIIEIKSVETVKKVHHKQVLTYMKLSNKKIGYLINFNEYDFPKGIFRKII